MAKRIGTIYGDALFSLALEEERVDRFAEEITLAAQVFRDNEELMKLLNHPEIVKEEKTALVENAFRGRVSDGCWDSFMSLSPRTGITICRRFLYISLTG